jgi:protein tyrosine/serine phosphatase
LIFFEDIQNDLGGINNGLVYALYDYDPNSLADNELEFKDGDQLIILRRGDENESEWWWAKHKNTEKEGYVPRNYLGVSYHQRKSLSDYIGL